METDKQKYPRRFGHTILAAACLAIAASLLGCALPTDSLVLENRPTDPRLTGSTMPIPKEWEGRLLRVGDGSVSLGGSATHTHSFSHVARGYSGPPSATFKPLGLKSYAASGDHVHLLESRSEEPAVTGPASNLPPSRVMLALIVTSPHLFPVEGQIIAYVGKGIPNGWLLCDGEKGTPALQGRYVVLSRGAGVPGLVGSDTHVHHVSFKDTWSVAATDPAVGRNRALHLDFFPAAHPTLSASPLGHSHRAVEPNPAVATTSAERVRPPTIEVPYLQATDRARYMPLGAIIPYTGIGVPLGWRLWRDYDGKPVSGLFLAGSTSAQAGRRYGSETHTHTVTVTHHVILYPNSAGVAEDVPGKGPPVATADHTHTANITETFTTAPASDIPLFVSVRFLIKK